MAFVRRHWAILLLVLLPLVPLWRTLAFGETIGPFDQIRQMQPWNVPAPPGGWDVLQADGVLQFYVWRDLVLESWRRWEPPFWNPYQLCGTPLLANSQSAGFYPLHVVFGVLQCPTPVAVVLLAWFHLAWGGLGARFLALRLGANEWGAALAGSAFGLSALMLAWTPLASVITTVSWIPWCLGWAVPTASGSKLRQGAWLAMGSGMMLLGGHLQFAAYGFIGVAVLAVVLAVGRRDGSILAIGACALVGGLIAAPQMLPTLEYSKFSHRAGRPTEEGWAAYSASALRPVELAGIVFPAATGLPGKAVQIGSSQVPSFWPAYAKRGANFAESAVSLGPAVVLMLGLLVARRRWQGLAGPLIVAAVGGLLAFGPLSAVLYFGLPGWSSTGSPGRAVVLVVIGLCVAAGLSVREPEGDRLWRPAAWTALASLALTILLALLGPQAAGSWLGSQFPMEEVVVASLALAAPSVVLGLVLALVGIWFYGTGRIGLAMAALVAAQLVGVASLVPTGKPLEKPPGLGADVRRAFLNAEWDLLAPAPALMPPNTASLFRSRDVGGYDSLLHRDTVKLLADANRQDPAPPANGNMMLVKPGVGLQGLADLGVTEYWSWSRGEGLVVKPLPGPGRISSTGGPPRVVSESPGRITVECEGPGRLTVRERAVPGWLVEANGEPVGLAGETWIEVELKPGPNRIVAAYRPPGLETGLALFALGSALVAAALSFTKGRAQKFKFIDKGTSNGVP